MLSVRGHDALKAAVLAFKAADRTIRSDINRATRATMSPVWKAAVERHATYARDSAVIAKGARIVAGDPPVAVAATSKRRLSGGFVPAEQWYAVEFGADRTKVATYQVGASTRFGGPVAGHTRKGVHVKGYKRSAAQVGPHSVTRRTARQLPPRYRNGRVAYPAFAELAPRLAALWAQLIVRKYMDAADDAAGRGA